MNGKKTKSIKNEKPKKSRKIEPEPAKPTIFIPSGLKWAQSDHVTEILGMFYRLCGYRLQSLRGWKNKPISGNLNFKVNSTEIDSTSTLTSKLIKNLEFNFKNGKSSPTQLSNW